MAYQDFIWKYISQALTAFDPQNETNIFNIKNIRHFYEQPVENNLHQNNQSLNQSGVFTNPRHSLYQLIQNLKTPGGLNSSAHESFFTIDNKATHPNGVLVGGSITPNNPHQHYPNHSLSSFNFSDISKIQDLSQTPGGFMSGIFRATPIGGSGRGKIAGNPYSVIEPNEDEPRIQQIQRSQKARTFADRVDESLQTLEGIKRKNFSPISNQLNNKQREFTNKNQGDIGGSYKLGYGVKDLVDQQHEAPARQYGKGYRKQETYPTHSQYNTPYTRPHHHHKVSSDVPEMLPLDYEDQLHHTDQIVQQMKFQNQREADTQQMQFDKNFPSQQMGLHKKVYIRSKLNSYDKNNDRGNSQAPKGDRENQEEDQKNDTLLSVTQDAGQGQGGQQIVHKGNNILIQNQKHQFDAGNEQEENFDRNDDNNYDDYNDQNINNKHDPVDTRQLSFSEMPQSATGFSPVTQLDIKKAMKKKDSI